MQISYPILMDPACFTTQISTIYATSAELAVYSLADQRRILSLMDERS